MSTKFEIAEGPNAPAAPSPDTGTDGKLTTEVIVGADGAGGDYQNMFVTVQELILATDVIGTTRLKVTVTPILGDGSLGTPVITHYDHPQTMDAFQAAAGNART
jgi:hypothetical protein